MKKLVTATLLSVSVSAYLIASTKVDKRTFNEAALEAQYKSVIKVGDHNTTYYSKKRLSYNLRCIDRMLVKASHVKRKVVHEVRIKTCKVNDIRDL